MPENEETSKHPHPAEWALAALGVLALGLMGVRQLAPSFLAGQLLPCLALGLLPGTAMRLLGRSSWTAHRVGVTLGLVTFLVWNGNLEFGKLRTALADWPLLLGGLALIAMMPLMGAWRWQVLLKGQAIEITYLQSLRLVLVGFFFNQFVPGGTGGDVFRIYYVARGRRDAAARATMSVVIDRLSGMPPLVLLVVGACIVNWTFITGNPDFRVYGSVIAVIAALSAVVFAYLIFGAGAVLRFVEKRRERLFLGKHLLTVAEAVAAYRDRRRLLLSAFGIGLLAHLATVLACALFGAATEMQGVGLSRYFILIPMGIAVNMVPAAPGGAGQGELAFTVLFAQAAPGLGNGARGLVVMLCFRAAMLFYGLIGGIVYACGEHTVDVDEEATAPVPAAKEAAS